MGDGHFGVELELKIEGDSGLGSGFAHKMVKKIKIKYSKLSIPQTELFKKSRLNKLPILRGWLVLR